MKTLQSAFGRSILAMALILAVLAGSARVVYAGEGSSTPVTTIVYVDVTFVNDFDCAFPLVEQVTGAYRDTHYFDQNGLLVREYLSPQFQGALRVTWTNPVTGRTLQSYEASSIMIYYNPDGSFKKLMNQGLTFMVTVLGAGQPLLMDVGRIVIERGQGITFEAAPHQELNGETAAFCEYLANPG